MSGARLTLPDNPVGQLRRRVQAYLQIHHTGPHTAEVVATRLEVPPEAVQAALENLVTAGVAVRRMYGAQQAYVINGKQKRVRRPPTIEGMPVDEFIARNADPIWLHQNEMWEILYERENGN